MKKIIFNIFINTLIVLTLQSCSNTVDLPKAFFDIDILYPNPASTTDTLSICVNYAELSLDITKLSEVSVLIYKNDKFSDTLLITGIYNLGNEIGILQKNNYTKVLFDRCPFVIQCILDKIKQNEYILEVIMNKYKAKSNSNLIIFNG